MVRTRHLHSPRSSRPRRELAHWWRLPPEHLVASCPSVAPASPYSRSVIMRSVQLDAMLTDPISSSCFIQSPGQLLVALPLLPPLVISFLKLLNTTTSLQASPRSPNILLHPLLDLNAIAARQAPHATQSPLVVRHHPSRQLDALMKPVDSLKIKKGEHDHLSLNMTSGAWMKRNA
jgi:hypothetical protein